MTFTAISRHEDFGSFATEINAPTVRAAKARAGKIQRSNGHGWRISLLAEGGEGAIARRDAGAKKWVNE